MYDTVAALYREAPVRLLAGVEWSDYREHVNRNTGEVRRTRQASQGGVVVILHPDGTLKAERSLPKALTGQNAEDLAQSDVPDALAAVDRELHELVGPGLPPFAEWDPCRVDYPRSFNLEDPALVDLALRRLATVRLPRKGRPVVGESGSVAWPVGEFRPKFYSKGRETGDARYLTTLRQEVGVFSGRALGSIPHLLPHPSGTESGLRGDRARLRLVDVLVPEAHRFVSERFAQYFGGFGMDVDDLNDVQLLRSLVEFFGYRRAFGLLGLMAGWGLLGVRGPADLQGSDLEGQERTWYRAMADLRRYRDHLASIDPDAPSVEDVRRRVGLLARGRAA